MVKRTALGILLAIAISSSAYAGVNRDELVSYHLDYYSIRKQKCKTDGASKERIQDYVDKVYARQAKEEQDREIEKEEWKYKLKSYIRDFHPYGKYTIEWNDNIFKTADNPVDDIIHNIRAGLEYRPELSKTISSLSWRAGVIQKLYTNHSKDDVTTFDFNLWLSELSLTEWLNLKARLGRAWFDFEAGVRKDEVTASELYLTDDQDIFHRWIWWAGTNLSFAYSRWLWELGYKATGSVWTDDDYNDDAITHKIYTRLNYILTKNSRAFLAYEYRDTSRDNNNDTEIDELKVGITGKLTPKIRGTIAVGSGSWRIVGDKDDSFLFNTDLTYEYSSRWRFDFSIDRRLWDIAYTDAILPQEMSYGKTWDLRLGSTYHPGFDRKLEFRGYVRYTKDEYSRALIAPGEPLGRKDRTYRWGVLATRKLTKKFSIEGGYEYTKRKSNEPLAEYKNNIFSLGVKAEF